MSRSLVSRAVPRQLGLARIWALTGAGLIGLVFSATPAAAITNVGYDCSGSLFGNDHVVVSVSMSGTTPRLVSPGARVTMTDFKASLALPEPVVTSAFAFGERSVKARVTDLDVGATDARPATLNAATRPIHLGPLPLVDHASLLLEVPPAGALTIGGWTAQRAGTMTFSTSKITLELKFAPKATVAHLQCVPSPARPISTTSVS